jgi:hypothetical protein
MKKLFTILLITLFTSCGPSLERPKSNTDYKNIIGKPIKIENFELTQYSFPDKMNWNDAKKSCEALGDGWRLPTKEEYTFLIKKIVKIEGISKYDHWSSTEINSEFVYTQRFNFNLQDATLKTAKYYVRAVRIL